MRFAATVPPSQAAATIDISTISSAAQRVRGLFSYLRENVFLRWRERAPESRGLTMRADDALPATIGRWRVLELLGEGNSARVLRVVPLQAPHGSTEQYALKLQNHRQAADALARTRFLRESRILQNQGHRNIVRFVETGKHEGCPYLVMEMVEGLNLRQAIEENQPRLKGKIDWVIQICRGLAALHERGIVHRDLKPENIMTTRHGLIKIADFGLARGADNATATRVGHLVGTPAYMSPEYLLGHEPDSRSDLYSLGVIMYELFTGRMPFTAASVSDYLNAHLDSRPLPPTAYAPELPRELEAIILRLLDKRPVRRFPSATALRVALETLLAHLVGVAPRTHLHVA